jgi:hypothetical protein
LGNQPIDLLVVADVLLVAVTGFQQVATYLNIRLEFKKVGKYFMKIKIYCMSCYEDTKTNEKQKPLLPNT